MGLDMKPDFKKQMLPSGFRVAGWVIVLIFVVLIALNQWLPAFRATPNPLGMEPLVCKFLLLLPLVTGLFFVGFSRDKDEDSFTMNLRFVSLLTAVFIGAVLSLLYSMDVATHSEGVDYPAMYVIIAVLAMYITTYRVQKSRYPLVKRRDKADEAKKNEVVSEK